MIGLDTNVLVRYLAQDDPTQAAAATGLIESLSESRQGFVSIVVLAELSWVLSRAYGVGRQDLADVLDGLLAARELVLQHPDAVREGVRRLREGADFADAVIAELARSIGCDQTVTFDRRAAQHSGMALLS